MDYQKSFKQITVISRRNDEYALIQTAFSGSQQKKAAASLVRLGALLFHKKWPKPSFKRILTAGEYAYTTRWSPCRASCLFEELNYKGSLSIPRELIQRGQIMEVFDISVLTF